MSLHLHPPQALGRVSGRVQVGSLRSGGDKSALRHRSTDLGHPQFAVPRLAAQFQEAAHGVSGRIAEQQRLEQVGFLLATLRHRQRRGKKSPPSPRPNPFPRG